MHTHLLHARRRPLLAACLGAALILTACGSEDDGAANDGDAAQEGTAQEDSAQEETSQETDAGTEAAAVDYPVTVDTVYGEITLEEKPERVVAIGGAYIDMLAALDVDPVAYVGSPRAGDDLLAGYPWFAELGLDLDAHDLALHAEGYTPSLEAVASYEPDLIIGDGAEWAIDEAMAEQIKDIAPTYTPPHEYDEWDAILTDLGTLTGTSDKAQEAIAQTEKDIAAARDRLSGMEGSSFVFGDVSEQEVRLSTDVFMLKALGFEPDDEVAAAESVSLESLDQITSDVFYVMVWRADDTQEMLEADPRFAELPSASKDAVVFADAALTNAMADAGPTSLAWWADQVATTLEGSALNTSGR